MDMVLLIILWFGVGYLLGRSHGKVILENYKFRNDLELMDLKYEIRKLKFWDSHKNTLDIEN